MARATATYSCQECGASHAKWSGRCDDCGAWNTIIEEAPRESTPKGLKPGRGRNIEFVGLKGKSDVPPRKASNITEFEQPKTFLMYAMVGALIAQLVLSTPAMALVIFGIGGLLRFRTVVGEAKDTGRVILVTVVGLCCGLKIFVGAVLATLIGWILIWYLESQNAGRIVVKGLKDSDILTAAETYRGILGEAGCAVIRERKNLTKGRVTFIVKAPPELDAEALEGAFEKVPEEQRGVVDWEIS